MLSSLSQFTASLRRDVFAGIVVFLVALPLCLGISSASGVDPLAGLLAGVIGGTVVAVFSGSRLSVSGPAAGLVVIVVEATELSGGFSAFMTAVMIAGALQLIFGMLRVGRLAAYVPTSVVNGMLAAIGLLLIIQQVPVGLGLNLPVPDGQTLAVAREALDLASGVEAEPSIAPAHFLARIAPGAAVVSGVSLVVLFAWSSAAMQRFKAVKAVPGPLLVVIWGVIFSVVTSRWLPSLAIVPSGHISLPRIDSFAALGQSMSWPTLAALKDGKTWELGITVAIVASLETLLSLTAVSRLDPRRETAPPNRELGAQGIGNLLAGAVGALPITSVIVRSSANVQAGASTRLAAVIHGILLLLSLFLLVDVLNCVPLACLAAVLVHTGYKLASPRLFVGAWRNGIAHWAPFAATIVGVLLTDLLVGIGIGIAVSAVVALELHRRGAMTMTVHGTHHLLRFHKDVSFLTKVSLETHLAKVAPNGVLIVDASAARYVDHDIRRVLSEFVEEAPRRHIRVELIHLDLSGMGNASAAH
ncbi:SulP family inorganic anion transporter [Pararobbsia alpina]|uniref:SulP family inorganic anion transporter n=1 Tax=Pararobbsia alpina TaxID=621374 RepID=UPI0039A4B118